MSLPSAALRARAMRQRVRACAPQGTRAQPANTSAARGTAVVMGHA